MEEQKEEHKHKHEHHIQHHIQHHSSAASKSFKLNLDNIFLILAVILAIAVAINIAMSFSIGQELKEKTEAAKEATRPAKIELITIKYSECTDCFDTAPYVSYVKSAKVEMTNERALEFDSNEAKELIAKYGIQKVPTIIVIGEIGKAMLEGFEKKENALILSQINPPYANTKDGKVEGRVTAYYLADPSCQKCNDLNLLITQMKLSGIRIVEQRNISISSSEGDSLMKKYNLNFAPTMIMSKDAEAYTIMQQAWPQIGTKENDGFYVLRAAYPPFINLTTNEVRGLVDITYLADKSCGDCHNVSFHKEVLSSPQSFAIKLEKEEFVDIGDARGKELISKYNITKVPTVVLSKEAAVYQSSAGLRQFFSIENDGSFVFRAPNVLGNYKDLATNEVVKPQLQQQ